MLHRSVSNVSDTPDTVRIDFEEETRVEVLQPSFGNPEVEHYLAWPDALKFEAPHCRHKYRKYQNRPTADSALFAPASPETNL